MNSIAQKCRPKHQVLILKCYPATTKGAVDVKPNSSELSYLLYYATTRRSKVQKVGAFLEKKTATDVWRARIGNVQVTLEILKALIEKAPRDLPLYAPYVLKILILILRSRDITMVEASIPTFESFCENHDGASLSADADYVQQYGDVIKIYASFVSTRPQPAKVQPSAPVALRWRKAGLHAILSISSSEALASVAGRQLDTIMPVLLENLWTENEDYLNVLQERVQQEGNGDNDKLLRRQLSNNTVRTVGSSENTAAAGSTAAADKLAEEDLGVLAMFCLKQLFEANNRAQIRNAIVETLNFIAERTAKGERVIFRDLVTGEDRGWAPTLFEILSRWTPMQDRYVILVTGMETLVQSPLQEQNMKQQLVLATMIGALLRSDINLIGLSVMDVLLGLINHILRILQLGGIPHSQQKDVMSDGASIKEAPAASAGHTGNPITELVAAPSTSRRQLLTQLQHCVGDLATHIYYADQVSVMIKAILLRLKPSPMSAIPTAAAAVEDPEGTTNVISASGNLNETQTTDGFFSFDTAKVTALNSVKQILLVANHRSNVSGGASLGRNQVGVQVWEGTQWLLRDSDPRVRKAYADALLTWLDLETTKADLKAFDDEAIPARSSRGREDSISTQKQRAVSTASHREKSGRSGPMAFLQLLHLAIYENALQFVISEPDMVMLHILLANLVERLGVNAVHSGLPMVFRLQEDIMEVEEPVAKVRIGSLCHGYFWVLTKKFGFENVHIGREIMSEVIRRQNKKFWIKGIQIPPPTMAQVEPFSTQRQSFPLQDLEMESLKPFDDRNIMVDYIAEAYAESVASPPTSPPTSPGRNFNAPFPGPNPPTTSANKEIPTKMRNDMLSEWSRESAIAAAQESSKQGGSPAGSRSETQPRSSTLLAPNEVTFNTNTNGRPSSPAQQNGRSPSQAYGLVGGMSALAKLRKTSAHDSSPTRGGSVSSHQSTTRIDQLKKALTMSSSVGVPIPMSRAGRQTSHSDASSDSMVSYNFTASEMSYGPHDNSMSIPQGNRSRSRDRDRSSTGTGVGIATSGISNSGTGTDGAITLDEYLDETDHYIPPVPPLPASYSPNNLEAPTKLSPAPVLRSERDRNSIPDAAGLSNGNGSRGKSRDRVERSWGGILGVNGDVVGARGSTGSSTRVGSGSGSAKPMSDLESLLRGIGTGGGESQRGLVGREEPPY